MKIPKLCRHSSGKAFVWIREGKKRRQHYFQSKYGTPEVQIEYQQFVDELKYVTSLPPAQKHCSVAEIAAAYLDHARSYYRKAGKQTSEVHCVKSALSSLVRVAGHLPAAAFGPQKLVEVRERFIDRGLCRRTCNKHTERVRACFRWSVENGLVPGSVMPALDAVRGLRRGRCRAHDNERVQPVSICDLTATMRELAPTVRDLVMLMARTAARPGEACSMTLEQIDRSSDVWVYLPVDHKTSHHGRTREIFIGPASKRLILRNCITDPKAAVFRSRLGSGYGVHGLRSIIRRACARAGVDVWKPNQLRHLAATRIRQVADLETAKVVLGHADARVTQEHYAEVDRQSASKIAAIL